MNPTLLSTHLGDQTRCKRSIVVLFLAALGMVPFSLFVPPPAHSAAPIGQADFRVDRVLVKLKAGVALADLAVVHGQLGAQVHKHFPGIGNLQVIQLPAGLTEQRVLAILALYQQSGLVEYAEPDYVVQAVVEPNDFNYLNANPLFPASYNLDNILAVAATDRTDTKAFFSNFGAKTVDLGAPGAPIFSCWNTSDSAYQSLEGTSIAAPHVVGACALVWANQPSLTYSQVITRILSSTDSLPSLTGKCVTGGRLNLQKALSFASPVMTISPTTDFASTGPPGGPFTPSSQSYTIANTGNAKLHWTVSPDQPWVSVSAPSGTLDPGTQIAVTLTINSQANSLTAGTYTASVAFTNSDNGLGNATRRVALTVNSTNTTTMVWVEDALPAGAWTGASGGDAWQWVSSNPAPFSGARAHQSTLTAGIHYHYFTGASATLTINTGDILVTYVFLDPSNVPREVMLQWYDGASWAHAAYWGANLIPWGTDGTASQRPMGALPTTGQWVRLEVPASVVGLEGRALSGMNFILYDGRATWDSTGKSSP